MENIVLSCQPSGFKAKIIKSIPIEGPTTEVDFVIQLEPNTHVPFGVKPEKITIELVDRDEAYEFDGLFTHVQYPFDMGTMSYADPRKPRECDVSIAMMGDMSVKIV